MARATRRLVVATHKSCFGHQTTPGHPERPERLEAAIAGAEPHDHQSLRVDVEEARVVQGVARVHDPNLAERLRAASDAPTVYFDSPDNPVSRGTYAAACGAVAASLASVDAVLSGQADRAWVPVRPPGHHALRSAAMGFCFFNNVAIAAEELLARGVGPLVIVDFDVHHGNGTQAHFWTRDDVFYLSVHHYPFYPGTGSGDEVGEGAGRHFTRNLPLAARADDGIYCGALAVGLAEVLGAMVPEAWLISAGFDAHRDDPLGGMEVSSGGYGEMGRLIGNAAGEKPVLGFLEGGYDVPAIRESVASFLGGLL